MQSNTMRSACLLVAFLLVAQAAGAQLQANVGGKNKVRYDTFEWRIYDTPHFRVSFYDRAEPSLEKITSYAESSYDELARRLNYQILDPIQLIVYATHAEFEQTNVIVEFIPEGVGAFATPVRNRMVLPADLPDKQMQGLIQHELTHIFQYEILFQGRRGRAVYRRPPTWFMEGMASFFANDEDARDRAYMRDAALADQVPSIAQGVEGFYAYRFGHMVFEFVESEWGEEGLRDFVFSFRNTLGRGVARPFGRTLNLDIEEFDAQFRSWLRKRYADFNDRGNPSEFGRPFRVEHRSAALEVSPAASPSGDLVAAFSTYKQDADVTVFGVPDRRLYRNLTKGTTTKYQYLIAQGLTVGPDRGRDLAFSPSGDRVAVFARSERTRDLLLLDVHRGGIARTVEIPLPLDQAMQPAFSPDGGTIAFHAFSEGQADIFLLDLSDESITNLTDDESYDSSPTFSPDGEKVVYSSQSADWSKLVEISLRDPSQRRQLTFGEGDDEGAAFSLDGKRLFFASDREDGVLDVYQLDLESELLTRLTHVIGAAINPTPVSTLDGERVVFQGFGRGSWDLYLADPNTGVPVGEVQKPSLGVDLEPFVPAVSISVDPDKSQELKRRKLFLEDASTFFGIDGYNNFISQSYISFSDQYGDRWLAFFLSTIASYSTARASWVNLEPRLQWGVTLFDDRSFYYLYDPYQGQVTEREQIYRQTGALAIGQYPLSRYYRLEGSVGYVDRSMAYPYSVGGGGIRFDSYDDNYPFMTLGLVGDTSSWRYYGPHSGTRWQLEGNYAPDLDDGGTLNWQLSLDGRAYLPITRRSELAVRLFAGYADGSRPNYFVFGGYDSMRGFYIRSLAGNRAAFLNLEWRFPIIDTLEMPFLRLGGIRGRFFIDVGAAYWNIGGAEYNYRGQEGFTFMEDRRLVDGVSSYGFGFSVNIFGLPTHWDFIQRWDFKDKIESQDLEFWIGWKF